MESAPNFVTYYSKNFDASSSDFGLDNVEEIVGGNSPIKYNKIKNFPIYSVTEMNPSFDFDEESGLDISGTESEGIILPGTIEPQPDDLLLFEYHSRDENYLKLFRVENVEISMLESNSYYKINFSNFPADIKVLNERQVSEVYTTVYSNIGTDYRSIILEDVYNEARKSIINLSELTDLFQINYYNQKVNNFVMDNDMGQRYYDPNMSRFINKHKLFISRQTYLKNMRLHEQDRKKHSSYRRSIYYFMENRKSEGFPDKIYYDIDKSGMFGMFREEYFAINYLDLNKELDEPNGLNLNTLWKLSDIKNILDKYQNKNSVSKSSALEKMTVLFLKGEEIDSDIINSCMEYYKDNIESMDIQDFILFPCLMYIVKNKIDTVLR